MRRGKRRIYIYSVWEFISGLCARVCAGAKSIQVPTYASWSLSKSASKILCVHCAGNCLKISMRCGCAYAASGKKVCAQVCAEPETPIGCLGQSSFEIGYALGMRWPHSSLVIWIQLEQNQDPTGIHLEHSQGQRSGNLFQAYAPGYAPGPKASKFQPMLLGHA